MAYNLKTQEYAPFAHSQAAGLPDMVWTYEPTSEAFTNSVLMYRVFKAWNVANKHGFKLHDILVRGDPVDALGVARINAWVQGGGASVGKELSHWDAVRMFERITKGLKSDRLMLPQGGA